jgi:hypothetical protein
MKTMKRCIALATAVALFGSASGSATQYQEYAGGHGYLESRAAPNLAPGIALGALALAAIVALAIVNSNESHGHSH